MLMERENNYAVFTPLSNGEYTRYISCPNIEEALLNKIVYETNPLDYFTKEGWVKVKPTLETMTGGELLKNGGVYHRVLSRVGGVGELSVYAVSLCDKDKDSDDLKCVGSFYTAYHLKQNVYTYTIVDEDETTMTKEEAEAKLGVKIV